MSLLQGKKSGSLKAGVHPFGTTAVETASLLSDLLDVGIFVDLVVPLPAKVRPWNGVDEQPCVGVLRSFYHRDDGPRFHHASPVEDDDGIGDVIGGGKIVGDVDDVDIVVLFL